METVSRRKGQRLDVGWWWWWRKGKREEKAKMETKAKMEQERQELVNGMDKNLVSAGRREERMGVKERRKEKRGKREKRKEGKCWVEEGRVAEREDKGREREGWAGLDGTNQGKHRRDSGQEDGARSDIETAFYWYCVAMLSLACRRGQLVVQSKGPPNEKDR